MPVIQEESLDQSHPLLLNPGRQQASTLNSRTATYGLKQGLNEVKDRWRGVREITLLGQGFPEASAHVWESSPSMSLPNA